MNRLISQKIIEKHFDDDIWMHLSLCDFYDMKFRLSHKLKQILRLNGLRSLLREMKQDKKNKMILFDAVHSNINPVTISSSEKKITQGIISYNRRCFIDKINKEQREKKGKLYRFYEIYYKILNSIRRLVFLYKLKKGVYKYYDIEYDLEANKLCDISSRYKIYILERNRIYTFTFMDLIRTIKTNITYSTMMILSPSEPRNPYTNKNFSDINIYKIFMKMVQQKYEIPNLVYSYFKSNLSFEKFKYLNYIELNEIAVNDYLKGLNTEELYRELCNMFDSFSTNETLNIYHDLNIILAYTSPLWYKIKMVTLCKHLLFHYLMICNIDDYSICMYHSLKLVYKIRYLNEHYGEYWKINSKYMINHYNKINNINYQITNHNITINNITINNGTNNNLILNNYLNNDNNNNTIFHFEPIEL
jgi:hypothetical protein